MILKKTYFKYLLSYRTSELTISCQTLEVQREFNRDNNVPFSLSRVSHKSCIVQTIRFDDSVYRYTLIAGTCIASF